MALYVGCPMWQHPRWTFARQFKTPLQAYGKYFNSVEGNTTFYAVPDKDTCQKWQQSVPEGFRYSFKLPKAVTHARKWHLCKEYEEFFEMMSVFADSGPIQIQLPASFTGYDLSELHRFIEKLDFQYDYSVEVRDLSFFDKGIVEKELHSLLRAYGVNRTLFDTRPIFKMNTDHPAVLDAVSKKPRVPCHVVATASQPVIRFIGYSSIEKNRPWLAPWVNKIRSWLEEGKDVYLFIHTPDNASSPWLALDVKQWILNDEVGSGVLDNGPQPALFV